jgi:hypothetical protein
MRKRLRELQASSGVRRAVASFRLGMERHGAVMPLPRARAVALNRGI